MDIMSTFVQQYCIDLMIVDLIRDIRKSCIPFDIVVGIKNGGLHVSVPISMALHLPHDDVHISFYDENDERLSQPAISDIHVYGKKILLVDDLVDSGATLKHFKEQTGLEQGKDFYMACLYWKEHGEFGEKPDFWVDLKDGWITFPWEI
jgi:hypoxanthine phosphoribosyltransferase